MQLDMLVLKIFSKIKKAPGDYPAYEDAFDVIREYEPEDFDEAHKFNRELRVMVSRAVVVSGNHIALADRFWALLKRATLFDAWSDLDAYLRYVEWDREPEKKFYLPRRKVLRPIVRDIQDLMDDKLDLLTLSFPPGTGKSTLGIFTLSWIMGKYPDQPNLASAHSGMLTRSFYDGVSQIITDPEYLWRDVFPGVFLSSTNSKEETIDLKLLQRQSTAA